MKEQPWCATELYCQDKDCKRIMLHRGTILSWVTCSAYLNLLVHLATPFKLVCMWEFGTMAHLPFCLFWALRGAVPVISSVQWLCLSQGRGIKGVRLLCALLHTCARARYSLVSYVLNRCPPYPFWHCLMDRFPGECQPPLHLPSSQTHASL